MPRPKKPKVESFWGALTEEMLLGSELALSVRHVGASPEVRAVLTILINERPSTQGITDVQFILGYEHCLRRLRELFKAEPDLAGKELPLPTYITPETLEEITWQNQQ